MDEQKKYEVIKSLADHPNPNKQRAAITLDCTVRHINRMLKGYKEQGKEYFIHGNRGRKPANTIPDEIRNLVVDLYRSKYYDSNFEHFTELLRKHESINLSPSAVMSILEAQYILSPKVTKAKKKRIKEQLKADKKAAKTQKEADQIQANLVAVEDAHSRRPRAAYFGELEQMDATPYEWIPGQIWHLHLAIDDASGRITGGYFDTQETLNGYYHVFHQILTTYGIPYKFYEEDHLRRYGAHGTSHRFVTAEACKILGKKPEETCLITAHLGNGSSCSAIMNGKCVDTTMGFTPLEGLIMGTRSGSLDPAILFYIAKKYGKEYGTIDQLDHLVNKESGLLGLSGLSNDMRTLTQAASEGNKRAQIALDVFCYRLTREIGGLAMALPRIDAIVFTGGIGENSFYVRKQALDNLKLLGYQVDEERNLKSGKESDHVITKDGTPKAIVVATNEELLIALDTEAMTK